MPSQIDKDGNTIHNKVLNFEPILMDYQPFSDVDYSLLNDTQSFRVGISYNFGKFSALHKQKETENEEELKRIEKKSEIGPKTE